jgi:multidrug efflux pump subunit AcrB
MRDRYRALLASALAHRKTVAAAFLAVCGGTLLLIPLLGRDFFPSVDAGQFRLHVRARGGTRIEETARLVDQIEATMRSEIPLAELAGILDNIGMPTGGIPLAYADSGLTGTGDADILVSLRHGHRETAEYVRRLRRRLGEESPGATFYFLPADIVNQTINFGLPAPIDIQVVGRDREQNRMVAVRLAEEMRRIPGAVDVRVQQPADQPRLEIAVDRTLAAEVGVSERDAANAVLLSLSGSSQIQPNFWVNPRAGVQYPVNLRVPEYAMSSLAALQGIPLSFARPGAGEGQLLANVASLRRSSGPPIFSHYDIAPVIDVFGNVSGRDLGAVLQAVDSLIARAEKELPRGSFIRLRGQASTMRTSFTGLGVGLVVALLLVYLLLVVNFQSWVDPLVIVSALPGALAGTVWGLYLTFTTVSVPALMGAIIGLGVATANSVLVVTFARKNVQAGADPLHAVLDAGVGRLRPVLMTALAMIIGMLPMSLALGDAGEQNAPLGRAVIGGLVVATAATLLFVPVVFSLLHRTARPAKAASPNL